MDEQQQTQEELKQPTEDGTLKETKEQIVTEEMAEKLGVSKTLVGKPLDDLGKSLRELQTDYARTKSRLKEVEKAKQQEATKPNLAPDPLDFENKADYDRALNGYIKSMVDAELTPLRQAQLEQQQMAAYNTIQKQLPPGMNVETVAQEWMESVNFQPGDEAMFQGNVKIFQDAIVNYAKAKQLSEVTSHLEKETNDEVISRIRKSLNVQAKDFELNSVDKTRTKPDGLVQRILKQQESELQTE